METNESILTRDIVAIDDRKRLGTIKDLCVDCNTRAVSHYIISSATTNTSLVLPFEKSLAVGDTFMTIQNRHDFIPTSEGAAKTVIEEGLRLIGLEVFSRAGNRLGVIEGYEFDPTHGTVTKIILGKRSSFPAESFVFFSPDFVFVDDGETTAHEMRTGSKPKSKKKSGARTLEKAPRKTSSKSNASEEVAVKSEPVVPKAESAEEKVAETEIEADDPRNFDASDEVFAAPPETSKESTTAEASKESDEDAVLKEFLVDSVVNDDVKSKDGAFIVKKGTKLTKELVDEAQNHDALLLLTMSVEA